MTEAAVPRLVLIAAVARNGVIGADNAMPWRLPTDLRRFKALTLGKPVLMGRRTWDSIGRPLPGRHVIVLTGGGITLPQPEEVATTLEGALDQGRQAALRLGADEIMVAGGGTLYAALIGRADRLDITIVDAEPAGDTRFPPIDPAVWRVSGEHSPVRAAADSAAVTFRSYSRL